MGLECKNMSQNFQIVDKADRICDSYGLTLFIRPGGGGGGKRIG
jgi:hypothetical protein